MSQRNKPECLKKETVAKSRLFEVEQLSLRFANGQRREYERLVSKGHGAVLMIAMPDDEHFFLVSEYAVGTDSYELGFPKGRIDKGENPLNAANRELKEELGFGAKTLTPLKSLHLAPGYFGSSIHIIVASNLYEEQLEGDEPEPLDVVRWNIDNIAALLGKDDFTEARSVAALLLLQQHLSLRGL